MENINKNSVRSRYPAGYLTGSSKLESRSSSDSKGYTLVEVLVVIGLISILTAIAVPQVNSLSNNFRLNGATRLVWGDLQNAKMTAIKTNGSTTVTFNSTTNYSYPQGGGTTFTRDLISEYPNITVIKTGGGPITFGSTGTTSSATITVQSPSTVKTISVLGTGRIIIN